ncbi:MAG: exo-alpha-sialidase [Planctomycetes bacterium]|nr:exo-alpha-sialidase [Planctomycetota bacterium]
MKHFWAAISKVDGTNWVDVRKMEVVPGAPSELRWWHKARLVARDDVLRAWIDGRPLSEVRDEAFRRPGPIGLAGYASQQPGKHCTFRNVVVRGSPTVPGAWSPQRPEPTWFVVDSVAGSGCSNIVRAANGDLLAMVEHALLRSSDNGRNWTRANDGLPKEFGQQARELYLGALHVRRDGVLDIHAIEDRPPFQIVRFSSSDHGRSWLPRQATGKVDVPPGVQVEHVWPQSLLQLKDGSLLWFAYTTPPEQLVASEAYPLEQHGRRYDLGHRRGSMSISMRSTDEGGSWQAPVDLDGVNPFPQAWTTPMAGSEVSSAQARDGTVVTLIRPGILPYVWESRSGDGGWTWTPATPGAFAMYAGTQSMICTASGALLFGARHPGMAVRASFDDGMSWRCYRVDTTSWGNGAMFEVAPDLVLYVYGAHVYRNQLRGQFLRAAAGGLTPVARENVPPRNQ